MAKAEDTPPSPAPFEDVDEAVRALHRLRAGQDETDRRTLERVEATLREVWQRADAATAQSLRDPLTDLANQRAWRQALHTETERCHRDGTGAVLVVIDLDYFKPFNDSYGHLAGDLLLRRVAATLQETSRVNDVVARIGGDEFAVIAVSTTDQESVAARVRDALVEAGVSASVGSAAIHSDGDLADAWARADRAMYEEKMCRHGHRSRT